jgi:hypothetical protein
MRSPQRCDEDAAMLHHLSVESPPLHSAAFLGLVAVLAVVLIALVVMLWGPPWWKGRPPRK